MPKRSNSGKKPPAINEGVEIVRLAIRSETKLRLDELAKKQGRLKYRLISGLLDWMCDLPDSVHLFVLGEAPRIAYKFAMRDLVRAIVPEDLTAEEQQMLIDEIKSRGGKTNRRPNPE